MRPEKCDKTSVTRQERRDKKNKIMEVRQVRRDNLEKTRYASNGDKISKKDKLNETSKI